MRSLRVTRTVDRFHLHSRRCRLLTMNTGDYVEIDTGTVHLVISLDGEYAMIQTINGDVWIPLSRIVKTITD